MPNLHHVDYNRKYTPQETIQKVGANAKKSIKDDLEESDLCVRMNVHIECFVYLPLTKFQIKIEKLTKTLKLESHLILELYNNVELIRPSTRNAKVFLANLALDLLVDWQWQVVRAPVGEWRFVLDGFPIKREEYGNPNI
ncbi:hypothetical protein GQX74_001447 [Glossina fuscipes]|nr:hypothetical protein GQX74_001447 [Glossina fuscipes]